MLVPEFSSDCGRFVVGEGLVARSAEILNVSSVKQRKTDRSVVVDTNVLAALNSDGNRTALLEFQSWTLK